MTRTGRGRRSGRIAFAGLLSCSLLSCSLLLGGDLDDLSSGNPSPIPTTLPEGSTGDVIGSDVDSEATAPGAAPRSCDDLPAGTKSGVVELDPDGTGPIAAFKAYCDLDDPPRKWTLALKIDGAGDELKHDSPLWTNDATFNPDKPDLDQQQAKLASFLTMAFTEIRVGMRDDAGAVRWVRAPVSGTSLRSMFNGPTQTTMLGRDTWKSLMDNPRLQGFCNAEGFNVETDPRVVRVGLVANNEGNCLSTDSYIGLGGAVLASGSFCSTGGGTSCGSLGPGSSPTFGYLMIR